MDAVTQEVKQHFPEVPGDARRRIHDPTEGKRETSSTQHPTERHDTRKDKEELDRMESMGVISKVNDPTPWCAGMVVVPKKNGTVRICVDLPLGPIADISARTICATLLMFNTRRDTYRSSHAHHKLTAHSFAVIYG